MTVGGRLRDRNKKVEYDGCAIHELAQRCTAVSTLHCHWEYASGKVPQ